MLNADLTWRSWSHAPTIANHRGVLFRDSSELCISLCSSPSVFGFRPCGPWAPPSCLDDRILTGGHSTRAGPRTVSCVALERALNFPDFSTFFSRWCVSGNARGPWAPPSWFLQNNARGPWAPPYWFSSPSLCVGRSNSWHNRPQILFSLREFFHPTIFLSDACY